MKHQEQKKVFSRCYVSRISEEENAELYIRATHTRAQYLLDKSIDQFVQIN